MTSAEQPPGIDPDQLRAALVGRWGPVSVIDETGSTNADLLARAEAGTAGPGTMLVAGHQYAGRGRLGRTWTAPPWASVATSVLLRPGRPSGDWGWISLITGLAVSGGIVASSGLPARLKWPNDVLIDGRKVCGILSQPVPKGDAVVVGFGLNTSLSTDQLPVPTAGSLALAAAAVGQPMPDPTAVLAAILIELKSRLDAWDGANHDDANHDEALRADYLAASDTIGREVRVELGDSSFHGIAQTVNHDGELVVSAGGESRAFRAGDVVHLRPS